jgi:hypothetical protein
LIDLNLEAAAIWAALITGVAVVPMAAEGAMDPQDVEEGGMVRPEGEGLVLVVVEAAKVPLPVEDTVLEGRCEEVAVLHPCSQVLLVPPLAPIQDGHRTTATPRTIAPTRARILRQQLSTVTILTTLMRI